MEVKLLDVATDLDSLADLRPGDAFDWPQRHVRLFTGMAEGAAIAFVVLESSTRFLCQGVCERTYRPSEMHGYRLIRYKGITDNAGVAGNAKPNGAAAAATAASHGATTAPAATSEAGAAPARRVTRKSTKVKARAAASQRRVTIIDRRTSW